VLVITGVHYGHRERKQKSDQHDFTHALYALYELMYLLTPESDHDGFTNALYAFYELL
jgi:hypothetical protein